ncbi:MAG: hypothetical protein MHM6MM_005441 [Cercozoa sp. M6MM]
MQSSAVWKGARRCVQRRWRAERIRAQDFVAPKFKFLKFELPWVRMKRDAGATAAVSKLSDKRQAAADSVRPGERADIRVTSDEMVERTEAMQNEWEEKQLRFRHVEPPRSAVVESAGELAGHTKWYRWGLRHEDLVDCGVFDLPDEKVNLLLQGVLHGTKLTDEKEKKAHAAHVLIEKYGKHPFDCGNPVVQMMMVQRQAQRMKRHVGMFQRDRMSRHKLDRIRSKRRKLFRYARRHDYAEYKRAIDRIYGFDPLSVRQRNKEHPKKLFFRSKNLGQRKGDNWGGF